MEKLTHFLKNHLLGIAIFSVATGIIGNIFWEQILEAFDKCESVVPIKQLGWSSGNKTNFCIAKGFGGHFNFAEYKAGGYCFTGERKACVARVEPGLK